MRYLLALAMLLLAPVAHADTLQLFTEQVAIGQPFGIELCDVRCITTPYGPPDILEGVSFIDTGVPQAEFFTASDPNVDQMIAYFMNPQPDGNELIHILDGDSYGGHLGFYPIPGDSVVTGMLIQLDGSGDASYSLTGTNLVPETGTLLLTLLGIVGLLAATCLL
jgi:hypothetical protein